jgi:hypothetical protein
MSLPTIFIVLFVGLCLIGLLAIAGYWIVVAGGIGAEAVR